MAVKVNVAGGTPDKVELLANDALLAPLGSQRAYDWDTASAAEGAYRLVARAVVDGQVVTSEPRTVVVDRTVPTALSRSPQNDDGNVPLGTPFQVVFSEPMSPPTITDSTVSITDAQGTPSAKQLILSADGKTLTIVLGGTQSLPETLTVGLQGPSDLAGNALAPVGPWSFTLQAAEDHSPPTVLTRSPEAGSDNVQLGTPFQVTFSEPIRPSSVVDSAVAVTGSGSLALSKHLALSPDGRTLAITLVGTPALPTTIDISVHGLTDFAGNPLSAPATGWSFTIPDWWHPWPLPVTGLVQNSMEAAYAVATDASGAPFVAYIIRPGYVATNQQLFVRRWTGAAWVDLGSPLNVVAEPYGPALAVAPDGTPIIAWLEYNGQTSQQYVMVARWSGSAWTSMSGSRLDSSQALNINRSTSSTWWLGSTSAMRVLLALDGSGNPTVAWAEVVPSGVYNDTAFNMLVAQWNGSVWNRLGSANTYIANNALRGALVLEGGHPIVAVEEMTVAQHRSTNVYVRRWDNGWSSPFGASPINGGTSDDSHMPAITLDAGSPVVAYCEFTQGSYLTSDAVTKKWSPITRAWETFPAGAGDRILDAKYPSLAVDRDGNMYLAYSAFSGREPRVLRRDRATSAWKQIGSTLSSQAHEWASSSLALTPQGVPLIAWAQGGANVPLTYDLMIETLNH